MYTFLLAAHSLMRWLVLGSLLTALVRSMWALKNKRAYAPADNSLRHWTATLAHLQLLLGISLYSISPITAYFMSHPREALPLREIRFFGMEHSLVMLLAVLLITVGAMKARRLSNDRERFLCQLRWYGLGLLLILSSIPWAFSPLVSRPWFRGL